VEARRARAQISGAQMSGAQLSRVTRRHEAGGQCSRPFSASWPSASRRGSAANLYLGMTYAQGSGLVPV